MKQDLGRLLKAVNIVATIVVLASCQRNLTQLAPAVIQKKDSTATVARMSSLGEAIAIDSIYFTLPGAVPVLSNLNSLQKIQEKVKHFYKVNNYKTKWLKEGGADSLYYAFNKVIENAAYYGLQASDYDVSSIKEQLYALYSNPLVNSINIVSLDVRITELFFLFSLHLQDGKMNNLISGKAIWIRESKKYNQEDITALVASKMPSDLIKSINKLQPAHEQYGKLQTALEKYRLLETTHTGSFPIIAVKQKIKPYEHHTAIPAIRNRIYLVDMPVFTLSLDTLNGMVDTLLYDQQLVSAIKIFQARHGLEADGIIGEKTVKFLNLSFKEQADIIALNMERMRWVSNDYNDNYILINVPEFKLRLYQHQKLSLDMNVIVGSIDKPTPIFRDEIQHIVFSPTWTVPTSIIKEEIIPRLRKNPTYYAEKNYSFYKNESQVDPTTESWIDESINPYQYRIVQQPGPDNSLGLVKFGMPNNMSVYLHDTPNHSLFSKSYRALSHGCVRLSEPAKLAAYLLRNQKGGWDSEAIYDAMHANSSTTILLKKRCKVYIEYRTAWVDENGILNIREDVYGHDKMQLAQLFKMQKVTSPLAGI